MLDANKPGTSAILPTIKSHGFRVRQKYILFLDYKVAQFTSFVDWRKVEAIEITRVRPFEINLV